MSSGSFGKTFIGATLGCQKRFLLDNAVSYFVPYYDFYQPEAYIPQTDTHLDDVFCLTETRTTNTYRKINLQFILVINSLEFGFELALTVAVF